MTRQDLEIASLHRLMRGLSRNLCETLKDTAEAACEVCDVRCAGITLLDWLPDGTAVLRWMAAAGPLRGVMGQTLPLDRNLKYALKQQTPRVVYRPHRQIAQIAQAWDIAEALLIPWSGEKGGGILWVLPRADERRLDEDDVRVLTSLAAFARSVIAKDQVESCRLVEERVGAAARMANELAHAVNNPLQALTNALYLMGSEQGEHLQDARAQVQRINTLVRVILDSNARPFKH
jgi:signal transduction histidine kinase